MFVLLSMVMVSTTHKPQKPKAMKKFLRNVLMIMCIFSGMKFEKAHSQSCTPCANLVTNESDCDPTNADGDCSVAIGGNSTASGDYYVALCTNSTASGVASVAIGNCGAIGVGSISIGVLTESTELNAISVGTRVKALEQNSLALGRLVQSDAEAAYIFGNGIGSPLFTNSISNSMMFGMNSTLPTMFIEGSSGVGTWGRVGIGTTAPQGILHVRDENGDDTDLIIDRHGTAQANLRFNTGSTGQRARIGLNNSGNHLYYDMVQANSDHIFQVNGSTEAMRIVGSAANVGIGTSSTSARLHVALESSVEQLAAFTVPDAADDYLRIRNRTGVAGRYAPMIVGYSVSQTDLEPLTLAAWTNSGGDAGGRSMMNFDVRRADSFTDITVRPLFTWSNNGAPRMLMKADGNLGIGTTAPAYQLELSVNSAGKPFGGSWANSSDFNLKTNVEDFTDGLEVLLQFQPKWYSYNGTFGLPSDGRGVGVIAQDVLEIAPYMIDTIARTDTTMGVTQDFLSYDGSALTYIIVNSIKELEQRLAANDELTQLVTNLNEQVNYLQQVISDCCNASVAKREAEDEGSLNDNKSFGQFIVLKADPNPFSDHVRISFQIPQISKRVEIIISDSNGQLINRFDMHERGDGEVTFYGSGISSGIYHCSLVVDARVVQTRTLVKN